MGLGRRLERFNNSILAVRRCFGFRLVSLLCCEWFLLSRSIFFQSLWPRPQLAALVPRDLRYECGETAFAIFRS